MQLSAKGAAFVRLHEGFVAKYYRDPVGVGTIGIGFTWKSESFRQWWYANKTGTFGPSATMTRAEAESALTYLFSKEYGTAVDKFLAKSVAQHVFDAMASVTYNCGPGALAWKWAAAVKRGALGDAAIHLRTTATTAAGKTLAGLVRRRKEEALLLEKGIYTGVEATTEAMAPTEDAMADGILIRGERGPAVAALIRDLHSLGYYDGVLDDVFGYGTEAAVLAAQRAYGLKADGYAGEKTLAAIAAALTRKAKPATKNWLSALLDIILGLFTKK
jgi:lysozyme